MRNFFVLSALMIKIMLWSKEFKRGTKGSTTDYLYLTSCLRKNQKKMLFYADSRYNEAWPTGGPHLVNVLKTIKTKKSKDGCLCR